MGSSAVEEQQLSHEEVWDDSSLIDSWNEALAEYKKYHSVHARGGSLKDIQAQETSKVAVTTDVHENTPPVSVSTARTSVPPPAPATATAPPVQVMLGSIKDEGLKRLLVSWYYAGYYTGLYEGQQLQVSEATTRGEEAP